MYNVRSALIALVLVSLCHTRGQQEIMHIASWNEKYYIVHISSALRHHCKAASRASLAKFLPLKYVIRNRSYRQFSFKMTTTGKKFHCCLTQNCEKTRNFRSITMPLPCCWDAKLSNKVHFMSGPKRSYEKLASKDGQLFLFRRQWLILLHSNNYLLVSGRKLLFGDKKRPWVN